MSRRCAQSLRSLSFPFYDLLHQRQLKGQRSLEHCLPKLFHPDSGVTAHTRRVEQEWRFLPLFGLAAFLLYAGLTANAQVAPGTPSFVPQDCHEFDCIDLLNNNVILNATIRNKSGLFPMNAMLSMDSYMQITGPPFAWWPSTTALFGYTVNNIGVLLPAGSKQTGFLNSASTTCPTGGGSTTKYWNFYFVTGDGASHFLPATDVTYASPCNNNSPLIDSVIDGTGYVLTINNAMVSTVQSSGGATVVQTSVSCGFDGLGTCYGGTVTDSNGNVLAVSDSSPFDVTDTMGVTALAFSGRSTTSSSFAWNDVTGHQQSVSVAHTTEGIATGFSCSPGPADYYPAVNEALPTSITFADGRSLGISYETTPGHSADTTGRVAGLTLPETGTVSYTYGQGTVSGCSNGINGTYETVPVLTRKLGNGDTTTYTLTYANTSGSNYNATNTRVDPGGNTTIYTFSGLTSTGNQAPPVAQLITEVQKYQGTARY